MCPLEACYSCLTIFEITGYIRNKSRDGSMYKSTKTCYHSHISQVSNNRARSPPPSHVEYRSQRVPTKYSLQHSWADEYCTSDERPRTPNKAKLPTRHTTNRPHHTLHSRHAHPLSNILLRKKLDQYSKTLYNPARAARNKKSEKKTTYYRRSTSPRRVSPQRIQYPS